MQLGQIIRSTGASILIGSEETEIISICCDSLKIEKAVPSLQSKVAMEMVTTT